MPERTRDTCKRCITLAHAKGEQAIKDGIATPLAPPRPEPIIAQPVDMTCNMLTTTVVLYKWIVAPTARTAGLIVVN